MGRAVNLGRVTYRLLGPLEVLRGGKPVEIGGVKERTLLALLLLDPNRVRPVDRLIDELWGDGAPESANVSLRVLVSHVRKALAAAGETEALVTSSPGYVLKLMPDQVDALRFEDLAAQGRAELASGDAHAAATTLRDALALWRGPALAGIGDAPAIAPVVARLEESRLAVLEDRIEADLASGRHATLAGELEELVATYPLRERLWRARLLALYRSGRQAESLSAYQELRTTLVEELGIEPSPEVAELHRAILAQDASLDVVVGSPRAAARTPTAAPTGVVTFLLTDIEGSSAAWERDPDGMSRALERHDELIEAFVGAGGGVLVKEKGEGDATLAVFRRATEALATAVDLQQAFASEAWPPACSLKVRMALHTGEAHEREGDYYGPTVNRAARLRAIARGGHIVLSQATAELVRDHLPTGLALIDLGTHELKGLARGEHVFEVGAESATRETSATEVPTLSLPRALESSAGGVFVGRSEEVARLKQLWKGAVAGQRRVAFVAGEPGIGKTRLAAEFARTVHEDGAIVLFGRCDEDLGVPYQPFAEGLRPYIAVCPASLLRSSLGHKVADLERLLPELAERLPDASRPSSGDPEEDRYRLFDATSDALKLAASRGPVLLILDDVHWAAKPTLLLLRHLMQASEEFGLLVIATYRDTELDRQHPLAEILVDLRRTAVEPERIVLRGLDVESVAAYVSETSGQSLDDRERELARILHHETDGNPFFIGEMIRHLVERGAIVRKDGRWAADLDADVEGLPEGIRDVITRRLSRLSENTNKVLALASVIGPAFSLRLLEGASDAEDRPIDAVEEAARAGLIVEGGQGLYSFAHALIRQTLYSELSSVRRMRLHRRVGQALEELPNRADVIPALAHHFAEAALDGVVGKAADYALAAGEQAFERLAHEEAVVRLERGLEILDLEQPVDRARRAQMLLTLSRARRELGAWEEAGEAALRAADDARALDQAPLLAAAALAYPGGAGFSGRDEVVASLCEEALAVLGEDEPGLRAMLKAKLAQYRTFVDQDRVAGTALAREALALARQEGTPATPVLPLLSLARCLFGSEDVRERLSVIDELVVLTERLGDSRTLVIALALREDTFLEMGDRTGYDEAHAELVRQATRYDSRRSRQLVADKESVRAVNAGDFETGIRYAEEAFGASSKRADAKIILQSRKSYVAMEQGRLDEARALWASTLENEEMRLMAVAAGAGIEAEAGNTELASKFLDHYFEEALRRFPVNPLRWSGLCFISQVVTALDRSDLAAPLYEALMPGRGLLCHAAVAGVSGDVDRQLAIMATLVGNYDAAEQHFTEALEVEGRMLAPRLQARTKYWYARMLLKRDGPGDRSHAQQLLASSLAIASELGLAKVAEDARTLLAPPEQESGEGG